MVTIDNDMSIGVDGKLQKSTPLKGLSTDVKPINVGINTLFFELDTNKFYYFSGEAWTEVGKAPSEGE